MMKATIVITLLAAPALTAMVCLLISVEIGCVDSNSKRFGVDFVLRMSCVVTVVRSVAKVHWRRGQKTGFEPSTKSPQRTSNQYQHYTSMIRACFEGNNDEVCN